MKTINKFFCLATVSIASFGLTACSDGFFDRYPSDSMQMETYLKNDSELENILLNGYYHLQDLTLNTIYVNSIATDEAYDMKTNNSMNHISLNECTWDATLGITSDIWTYCFNIINRCNNVLQYLHNASENNRSQFEGEACFLRAYAYFTLVRLFGPVPLTTTPITEYATLYSYDRSSVASVYELIQADIATAIANLPLSYTTESKLGRATKIAAYTLQADVLMTLKDFTSAQTALDQIISYAKQNTGKLGLEADVLDIYASNNPMEKEIIFAAQFNNGATVVDNELMGRCILNTKPSDQPAYIYADGTRSTITSSQGTSVMLMTWELYNKLRENPTDQRFKKLTYCGIENHDFVSNASDEVQVTPEGYTLVPTTLKYFDFQNEGMTKCVSGNDNIIYRYADVLLMYAECLNNNGQTDLAADYLNQVRERAGIAAVKVSGKAEMELAIENERMLELCFEGHRWYDLVRTDRITSVMESHFAHRTPGLNPNLQGSNNGMIVENSSSTGGTPTSWKWSNSSAPILFGIPYDQLQLSGNWVQNELY